MRFGILFFEDYLISSIVFIAAEVDEQEEAPQDTEQDAQETEVVEPLIEPVEFRQATNFPAIWSEEGKYLANVLGDALVKGLSLVSQERPNDPVEYLSNFLRGYKDGDEVGGVEQAGVMAAALTAAPKAVDEETVQEEPEVPAKENVEQETPEETVAPEPEEPEQKETAEVPATEEEQTATEETAPSNEAEATEQGPEQEEMQQDHVPSTPEPEEAAPQPETEEATLNTELTNLEDKLEDALDEEESSNGPFDPVKDEKAEQALITSRLIEPGEDGDVNAFSGANSTRDESGQSVLHFACTRPGGGSTIMAFLQNPSVNLAWRDVNLRTARDVASNLNRTENVRVIDNYVVLLAQRGELDSLTSLLVDGYDHLADVEDMNGTHIVEVADNAEHKECAQLLRSAPEFRERVERVQRCVRSGDIDGVKSLVTQDKRVGYAINPRTGRNALHVAVLCEEIPIVKWLADNCVEAVKKTDNLERTCLHLSMGVDKCEKIVRILVRAGAKRVVKDLSEKQPSYYWNNRNIIGELQAEERAILN